MIENTDFYELGVIGKPFGVKGEIHATFDVDKPEAYLRLRAVYIGAEGATSATFKRYDIQNIRRAGAFLFVLQLAGVEDRTAAEALIWKILYLPMARLPALNERQFYYHEIIGCALHDEKLGAVGTVTRVWEAPAQDVIVFTFQEKEAMFPILDAFIDRFDRETRTLYTRLPEGLLEVYLTPALQTEENED